MTLTPSSMIKLGMKTPYFELADTKGNLISLSDFDSQKGLLIIFLCNHCPYVKHIRHALAEFAQRNISSDFAIVGINSNDATSFPADSPEKMIEEAREAGYRFPYLYDESQEVAKSFRAACTPDFFLYNANRELIYHGQFDDSRPGNDVPVTGSDLQAAVDALLEDRDVSRRQTPSVGCNIKWKPGNTP